jgi:IMP dehydrogenase
MNNRIKEVLAYDDVLLVPQYSDIESRRQIDVGNTLSSMRLRLPIISSPMDTVTEWSMCQAMDKSGGIGILHRYNSVDEQATHAHRAIQQGAKNLGAALGVTGDYLDRATALYDAGVQVICVDVAHGHHILVETAIKNLRDIFGDDIHIMAGNVATLDGFNALAEWGADSVRCNIGSGSICTTRIQTGHGVPGLHTIFECAASEWAGDVKIIADGGIKNSGDIVKALAAGADFVMLGSLLAGTTEAPGELIQNFGNKIGDNRKVYRGMASADAQKEWRGRTSSLEGIATTIAYKGRAEKILAKLEGGIRSGLSYSGARTVDDLHRRAVFIRQTDAGRVESDAHVVSVE